MTPLAEFSIPHVFYLLEERYNFPFSTYKGNLPGSVEALSILIGVKEEDLKSELKKLEQACDKTVYRSDCTAESELFLDLRSLEAREQRALPNAIVGDQMLFPELLEDVQGRQVITVCSRNGARSLSAALFLREEGVDAKAFLGAWDKLLPSSDG